MKFLNVVLLFGRVFSCGALTLGQNVGQLEDLTPGYKVYLEDKPGSWWEFTPRILYSKPEVTWRIPYYLIENQSPCHPEVLFYFCDQILSPSIIEAHYAEESLMKFALRCRTGDSYGPEELHYRVNAQNPNEISRVLDGGLIEDDSVIPAPFVHMFVDLPAPVGAKFKSQDIYGNFNSLVGRRLARIVHCYWEKWICDFLKQPLPEGHDLLIQKKLDSSRELSALRNAMDESQEDIKISERLLKLDSAKFQDKDSVKQILQFYAKKNTEAYFRKILNSDSFTTQQSMVYGAYLLELSNDPGLEKTFSCYLCDLVLSLDVDIARRAEATLQALRQTRLRRTLFEVDKVDQILLTLTYKPWPQVERSQVRAMHRHWRKWWFDTYEPEKH